MKDFFISYNKADRQWAEWIAWQLEEAGYSTVIQCWDFLPGSNFVLEMHDAARNAERTIGILSPDFLASTFTNPEWATAFVNDPTGKNRNLLLIRVQECKPDGLLKAISYIDLVGLEQIASRRKLLDGVEEKRLKPVDAPGFPGIHAAQQGPRFPGALPAIWNIPHLRNPNFTGRESMLSGLHDAFNSGKPGAEIRALTGLGGKGKTTIAREFAYRYHQDYDLIWWVRASETATLTSDYAALAAALDLPQKDLLDQVVNAVKFWLGQNRKWLLIFDNAQDPDILKRFLPQGGGGHMIITSRNSKWGNLAKGLPLEVFEPSEAVEFIFKRTNQNDEAAAEQLAKETGRLPLALEQAGAYIEETSITLSDYLIRFKKHRKAILERGKPIDYPDTVATTWDMSFQAAKERTPASADLLNLFSFLAPDDIPKSLILGGARVLPEPLASATANELEFDNVMAELRRYSLISGTGGIISVHQLVQVVTRDKLAKEEKHKWSLVSLQLLKDAFQFDQDDTMIKEKCAPLLQHVLASVGEAEKIDAIAPDIVAQILNNAGNYQCHFADFIEAKRCIERALKIDEKAFGLEHTYVARDLNNLGLVLKELGKMEKAKKSFARALKIDETAFGPEHPSVAAIANNIGLMLKELGEIEKAKRCIERALKICEKAFGMEHPKVATTANNLGLVLKDSGEMEEAKRCFERASKIDENAFGLEHPNVARDINNLGLVLKELGETEEARRCFKRTLKIDEKAFGLEHPNVARDIGNLGGVLRDMGEIEKAKICIERAIKIDENVFGLEHPNVARDVNNLGLVLQDMGEMEEAKRCIERALKIDENAFGLKHPSVARDINNLGEVLQDMGEMEKAKSCFKRSIKILQKPFGNDHPLTKKAKANLDALISQNH